MNRKVQEQQRTPNQIRSPLDFLECLAKEDGAIGYRSLCHLLLEAFEKSGVVRPGLSQPFEFRSRDPCGAQFRERCRDRTSKARKACDRVEIAQTFASLRLVGRPHGNGLGAHRAARDNASCRQPVPGQPSG